MERITHTGMPRGRRRGLPRGEDSRAISRAMIADREAGMTLREIAAKYGRAPAVCWYRMAREEDRQYLERRREARRR